MASQCVGALAGQDIGLGDNVWLLGDRLDLLLHLSDVLLTHLSSLQLYEECLHRFQL